MSNTNYENYDYTESTNEVIQSEEDSPTPNYRLSREERETVYRIDETDNTWFADSSVPKDIRRLDKQGWVEIGMQLYPDGTVMSKQFKAPRNCLSPRTYNPDKPKRTSKPMSEEHKQKLMAGRKKKSES